MRGCGGGRWRRGHGSMRGNPNNRTCTSGVDVHVHIHVHTNVHVHVDVIGAGQPGCGRHGAGRVVDAVVAVRVDVRGQGVIRVSGPVGKHAAAGLVRAVQDLVDAETYGLMLLLVGLVHLLDPSVLHRLLLRFLGVLRKVLLDFWHVVVYAEGK